MFSNGKSRRKRKMNTSKLNSEIESYFNPRVKRKVDQLHIKNWARFIFLNRLNTKNDFFYILLKMFTS